MSVTRKLGIFPKSGEQILKDALSQFRNIIIQIGEGIRKVEIKRTNNTKESTKVQKKTEVKVAELQKKADAKVNQLAKENETLEAVLAQASTAAENLKAILNDKIVIVPDDTVKSADTPSEESKD